MASYDRYYDCRVEYLESTGTQWIDTDIYTSNTIGFEINAMGLNNTTQYHAAGFFINKNLNNVCVFGSASGGIVGCFGGDTNTGTSPGRIVASNYNWQNEMHICKLNKGSFYVDGNLIGSTSYTLTSFNKIWIGAINNIAKQSGRIYGAKVWDNNILVRDLIPVRRGNVGYMYDRVSGNLFGNAGTGNFIIGPDIPVADKLIINNIPLRELGCVLAPDSYKSALQWSKIKSIASNDWAEYNYAEYDLSRITLDKRSVTLNFHATGKDGYRQFLNYLMQYVYSYYSFPELGITLRMRVDNNSIKSIGDKWQSFSITFFDDEPYRQQSSVFQMQEFAPTGYTLDGKDLSIYGIQILRGTLQSVTQKAQVKERLTINENSMNGVIYDINGDTKLKQQTFTLKCLLRAQNLTQTVANYYYLYELLRQTGTRRIHIKKLNENIDCFYNSSTVQAVHSQLASGLAGIAFDIVFQVEKRGFFTVLGNDSLTTAITNEDNDYLIGE